MGARKQPSFNRASTSLLKIKTNLLRIQFSFLIFIPLDSLHHTFIHTKKISNAESRNLMAFDKSGLYQINPSVCPQLNQSKSNQECAKTKPNNYCVHDSVTMPKYLLRL